MDGLGNPSYDAATLNELSAPPRKKPGFLHIFRQRRENAFTGGGCVSITLNAIPVSMTRQGFTDKKYVHGRFSQDETNR
jgi:hypothetical protein